jgi:hypothetical protein
MKYDPVYREKQANKLDRPTAGKQAPERALRFDPTMLGRAPVAVLTHEL